MEKVNIKIEGHSYQVDAGLTILEAAKKCGYTIPTLCAFNHGECSRGSCRVCLVEVKGARGLVASCVYPVNDGMEIIISSPKAVSARRTSVELLLSNHSKNCQQCTKNEYCELLNVAKITGARDNMYEGSKTPVTIDELTPSIIRDTSKCVLCGRCVERCKNAQGIGILGFENRGFRTIVAPAYNRSMKNSPCILCGQCVNVCPTGALMEKSEIDKLDQAKKEGKYIVVQTAPAVRAALGEEFGMPIGTSVTGKMVAALKRLGFDKVYDTNFAADLTIMEEATELLHRSKEGLKDVDCVLTTRELARLIKRSGIDFRRLPDEEFDQDLLGEYTGAGVIFGVTGGVMEAALRTAYFTVTGKEHELIAFKEVRGFDGLKEAEIDLNGTKIKVAVAHGMKNAKPLLDDIRAGKSPYTFIEIMGCPGGCINGGGQPFVKPCFLPNEDDNILDTYKEKRAKVLYSEDEKQILRQSHRNTKIQQLYKDYLGEPNSHKAHELLHTTYHSRDRYPN